MNKLSVIIVNYNVERFLDQCLQSVFSSETSFDFDVWVVDNHSVDGSVAMVSEKFPQVKLIVNRDNVGFSGANNQAIRKSEGEYVLLLNPDTIIESDTLAKTVAFMDAHPEGGGLGVMMLDGKGRFLPESKRGLPTPWAAFYKIFGLSSLFPHSKRFSAYHLGHLDKNQTHQVEILSGAFMLLRRKALDEVGLLDESFFMYGEDIDLSYRLTKGGYKNYYFAGTRIIHYKGESTKKDSINYVFVFYKAMMIFARKHFSARNARVFSWLINFAIIFKALLSLISSTLGKLLAPMSDFILAYAGVWFFAKYWGTHFAGQSEAYPSLFLYLIIPLMLALVQISVYYTGGYEKPLRLMKMIKGQFIGVLLAFVLYAFLPETYRFSRATVLFIALYIPLVMILWRLLLFAAGNKNFALWASTSKRIAVVGAKDEAKRVLRILADSGLDISRSIVVDKEVNDLSDIVKINKLNEVIFCARDYSSAAIIDMMSGLNYSGLDFKIAPPESLFIIGSNSINSPGEFYFQEINVINKPENRRYKRLFDLLISFLLVLLWPVSFFFVRRPLPYLRNLFLVLFGLRTFVGFNPEVQSGMVNLPTLKRGLLFPDDSLSGADSKMVRRVNMMYAREYRALNDLLLVFKAFHKLGDR